MSWHFSRALVEEYSADTYLDGERFAPSNTTPTPAAFYWPDKTTEHSRLSRFGMTSELLTGNDGEGLLTWFLAAFRAKTSASQGGVTGLMGSEAGCGQKWRASFARFDRNSCSWKTAQCSLLEDSGEFSETWPRWGSMRNGVSYLQRTPALPICESASGLWPTLCARDYRHPGKSRLERTGSKAGEVLPQVVGGPLSPTWAEWLMGWPVGWTDLRPLATGKYREWQQQHSIYSHANDKEAAA